MRYRHKFWNRAKLAPPFISVLIDSTEPEPCHDDFFRAACAFNCDDKDIHHHSTYVLVGLDELK